MSSPASHFINGEWIDAGIEALESFESYSGELLWSGQHAGESEVDAAMQAAKSAWPAWSGLDVHRRIDILKKYQNHLRDHQLQISELIARENGKPLWEAKTEAAALIGKVDATINSWNVRCTDQHMEVGTAQGRTRQQSLGVCVVLGPFNLPAHLANGQIVPALLAGNTIVFKPSEVCPAVGAYLVDIFSKCLPKGVINLVQGDVRSGKALLAHEDVAAVFFTGSYRGGAAIHKHFAGRPEIMLALEMGGNNPLVVWEAKDLEAAALLMVQSAFITAGQRCVCARRLIIPEGEEGDAYIDALLAMMKRIRVGDPMSDEEPFMSGVIHEQASEQVLSSQAALIADGAKVLALCERIDEAHPTLLSPGLLDVTGLEVEDEEIFGPLLQVYRVPDFQSAINEANNTAYGLSAGLISDNKKLYDQFIAQIRAGIVNWNRQITGASGNMPFGGIGQSGNHRAAAWHAVDFCHYTCASIEADTLSLGALPTGIQEHGDE